MKFYLILSILTFIYLYNSWIHICDREYIEILLKLWKEIFDKVIVYYIESNEILML